MEVNPIPGEDAFLQSDFWSFVIQYSKGVMKKFQGSKVAILEKYVITEPTTIFDKSKFR